MAVEDDPRRPRLPIFVDPGAGLSISGLQVVLDAKGWPRAGIAEGPVSSDRGRPARFVAFEFEEPMAAPTSKQAVEWIHFATARAELRRGGCSDLDGPTRFGADPPDFVVLTRPEIRVEVSQFTSSARRRALGLLNFVRRAIVTANPDRFRHLRGRLVMLGFDDPDGLPPRGSDQDAIDEILGRLDRLDPGPEPLPLEVAAQAGGFAVAIYNTPLGAGAIEPFPLPLLPKTDLAVTRGFELAAAVMVTLQARDIEKQLNQIVADHDRPANDLLLISAGAPGRSGLCLISDEVALEGSMLGKLALPQPDHVKRVLLHRWSFGDVHELYPSQRQLVQPRVVAVGGPYTVPLPQLPRDVWDAECPCGAQRSFADCHGTLHTPNGYATS
jgi:hypothetical protein